MEADRGQGRKERGSNRMQKPGEAGPPHLASAGLQEAGASRRPHLFLPARQQPGWGGDLLASYEASLDGHGQQVTKKMELE